LVTVKEELKRKMAYIASLRGELEVYEQIAEDANSKGEELLQQLEARSYELANTTEKASTLASEKAQLASQVLRLSSELEIKERALSQKDESIADLKNNLVKSDTDELQHQLKDSALSELQRLVNEKNASLTQLELQLTQKLSDMTTLITTKDSGIFKVPLSKRKERWGEENTLFTIPLTL
jgi:chromosome segregation ATPase